MQVNVVLHLAYDGTAFAGFQRQSHAKTVQGELERAASKIANEAIELVCAGRTDAGVHGTNQVVNFVTKAQRRPDNWINGCNALLPPTIRVLDCHLYPWVDEDDSSHSSPNNSNQASDPNPATKPSLEPTSNHAQEPQEPPRSSISASRIPTPDYSQDQKDTATASSTRSRTLAHPSRNLPTLRGNHREGIAVSQSHRVSESPEQEPGQELRQTDTRAQEVYRHDSSAATGAKRVSCQTPALPPQGRQSLREESVPDQCPSHEATSRRATYQSISARAGQSDPGSPRVRNLQHFSLRDSTQGKHHCQLDDEDALAKLTRGTSSAAQGCQTTTAPVDPSLVKNRDQTTHQQTPALKFYPTSHPLHPQSKLDSNTPQANQSPEAALDDELSPQGYFTSRNFHARFSANARRYRYLICDGQANHVGYTNMHNLVTFVPYSLDVEAMNQACQYLLGEQDFKSFQAARCQSLTSNRYMHHAMVKRYGGLVVFDVKANAFLYHMVRNIMGTLLEIGRGNLKPEDMQRILAAKDRNQAPPTAPPVGLYLVEVSYPDYPELAPKQLGPLFLPNEL